MVRVLAGALFFAGSAGASLVATTEATCPAPPGEITIQGSVRAECSYTSSDPPGTMIAYASVDFAREYSDNVDVTLQALGSFAPRPGGGVLYDALASASFAGDYVFTATGGSSGGLVSPCVSFEIHTEGFFRPVGRAYGGVRIGGATAFVSVLSRSFCLPPAEVAIPFAIGIPAAFNVSLTIFSNETGGIASLDRLEFYSPSGVQLTDIHYTLRDADLPEISTAWLCGAGLLIISALTRRAARRRKQARVHAAELARHATVSACADASSSQP